jgi:FtsP/CotA-like multicopper oxidase with cupredoxin domain
MDHSAHQPASAPAAPAPVDHSAHTPEQHAAYLQAAAQGTDGSGRPLGWGAGFPAGVKVLTYADLKPLQPQTDTRAPSREIVVRLTGDMNRYVWTLNGRKFSEADPVRLTYGERVRLTFVNETMMAHPMHLHGMFFQAETGPDGATLPDKHVLSVEPGKTASVLLTADAPGEWAFHCHLLFHMSAGMMTRLVVATLPEAGA